MGNDLWIMGSKSDENRCLKLRYAAILLAYVIFMPVMGEDLSARPFSSSNDKIQYINSSGLMNITALPLSHVPQEREEVFVIGEVALSQAAKDLVQLSEEGGRFELIESGEFTGLYSEMGTAFSIKKIPIKLSKFESQEKSQMINNSLDNDVYNITPYEELESPDPIIPVYEVSQGHRESAGGVNVIWDY